MSDAKLISLEDYITLHSLQPILRTYISKCHLSQCDNPCPVIGRLLLERSNLDRIDALGADEVIDSMGKPTLRVHCFVNGFVAGQATAQQGLSCSTHELRSLKDKDPARFDSNGMLNSCRVVVDKLSAAVHGQRVTNLEICDTALRNDGTSNLSVHGYQAVSAASLAIAVAAAKITTTELFSFLGESLFRCPPSAYRIPRCMFTVCEGLRHGGGRLRVEGIFCIPFPNSTQPYIEHLRVVSTLQSCLLQVLQKNGDLTIAHGPRGGVIPPTDTVEQAFTLIEEALQLGKLTHDTFEWGLNCSGSDAVVDIADNVMKYDLVGDGGKMNGNDVADYYGKLVTSQPIKYLVDPHHEDDTKGLQKLTQAVQSKGIQVFGSDAFATNNERIARGIKDNLCTGYVLKLNEAGTLSALATSVQTIRAAGQVRAVYASRACCSAETMDADIAVGFGFDYADFGGLSRGECVERHNRILRIERLLQNETAARKSAPA